MGLARQHDVGFDRVAEILAEDALQTCRDVRFEGVANVEMLAF